jgi:hypothetical protein
MQCKADSIVKCRNVPHRFAHTYVSEYTFTDANVPGIEAGFNFAGKFSFGLRFQPVDATPSL